MSSLHFISKKDPYAKRWLGLSIDRGIGTHAFQDILPFTRSERETVKKFLSRMDEISCKCSKARRAGQSFRMRAANKLARKRLEKTGKKLFNIVSRARAPIDNLDSLGEYGSPLILWVDIRTRKIPWELAFDGEDFLCTKFAVGRKVLNPEYEYIPQSKPLYREALVVGLNYDWSDCKHEELLHCELEGRSVRTQLRKLGYRVHVLLGKYATVCEVEKRLKKGVSVFHFTGHGAYRMRSRKGERGVLRLADGDLTTDDLRNCFECARGAPYLSFLNACQTAKEIYSSGLVDAFVDLGAENVVGTFWSVFDEPAKIFARSFYKSIVQGNTIGYAIQKARNTFIYGKKVEEATTWPAFVFYGDPNHALPRAS